MIGQDITMFHVKLSVTKGIMRENRVFVWDKPVPDLLLSLFTISCFLLSLVAFRGFSFQKFVKIQLFDRKGLYCAAGYISLGQVHEQIIFFKN